MANSPIVPSAAYRYAIKYRNEKIAGIGLVMALVGVLHIAVTPENY
jgi:hypothetical protein